jgi:threonyl-tRNA synthetase
MVAGSASEIEIELPDGSHRRVAAGTSAIDVLGAWDPERSREFLAAEFDRSPIDLDRPLSRSGRLAPLTFTDPRGREILQHSAAHLVAKAVTEVVPEAKPTNGPPTEDGFYYDFEMRPLIPEDLPKIDARMQESIRRADRFVREEIPREDARRLFAENPHKLRYIDESPDGSPVSVYRTGTFVDLCRGPHVPDARWLAGIHILGFSAITYGAATGSTPFQRVRGVGFPTKAELERFLRLRAEAEARDHRVLGPRLDLFSFSDELPGFPFWHPNGMVVVRELEQFVRDHLAEAGYSEIRTPILFPRSVFETSGHWEHYRENMFLTEADERSLGVKPMNCPGSMLIFRARARSYRELPMRLAEFAPLHRLEASGTIHGLTRAREFVQDDAHLFVTEDQIRPELRKLLDWIGKAMATFHLGWSVELSTRPEKYLGELATWERAQAILKEVLDASGASYKISSGEGAFYAPKIDIQIKDSMGRSWQCGTIQLDYQMPARFGLEYQGADGALHTPVVIHRTILGTWERFLGVLLEHCAGWLPPWLAPTQIRILPVSERQRPLALDIVAELRAGGVRAEASDSQDTLSKRIRESELAHIPYIGVVGDKEADAGTVALRVHGAKGTRDLPRRDLLELIQARIRDRSYEP